MNLIDLFSRGDAAIRIDEGVSVAKRAWGPDAWRALQLPAGAEVAVARFALSHPVWTRPDHLGWYAVAPGGEATLRVALRQDGAVLSEATLRAGAAPVPVRIPWPAPSARLDDATVLSLRAEGPEAVQVLVHRILSRQPLYRLARGHGVEVGPGPRPQILPSAETSVIYVEESPPDRWAELYDQDGRWGAAGADWSRIRVGKAADLPVEDGSIDFVFSSHVFEHLANPLGHLDRWRAKLRPGGLVLTVVPDMASTKDRHMRPSGLDEAVAEYEAGTFEPLPRHYLRHTRRLAPVSGAPGDPERARQMQERGESIHVHYYDRPGIARLLHEAVDRLGFTGFHLVHAQNHKDFHFVLQR